MLLPQRCVFVLVFLLICWDGWLVSVRSSVEMFESCNTHPEVHVAYFGDENYGLRQPPVLHYTSSSEDLRAEKQFPFQYILMTCEAPYPVEWISHVPLHYYYSYILDDEVRSTSNTVINGSIGSDVFTVRLHIGNETWANKDMKNISVVCQPVENAACGKTVVSIWKENRTMMTLRFDNFPHEPGIITDEIQSQTPQHQPNCLADFVKMENETLDCTVTATDIVKLSKNRDEASMNKCVGAGADLSSLVKINQSSLTPPGGVVSCLGNVRDQDREYTYNFSYFYTLPKLCPGDDITLPHLYYPENIYNGVTPTVKENDFLSLCVQNASTNTIFVGDNITVTCISSIYYFAQGMQLQLAVSNEILHRTNILNYVDLGKSAKENAYGPEGYRNITTTFTVESDSIQKIKCAAPVRKSRKWAEKTVLFQPKVPDRISFQRTPESAIKDASGSTYIVCNATGNPLPTLSWSRLSNEKFPSNNTLDQCGTIGTTGLGWISSKLYFPNMSDLNLVEYHGRYICTAKNKFNTFEKIFLFDELTLQHEEAIWSGGNSSGRAVWFWVMLVLAMVALAGAVVFLGWKLRKQRVKLRLFTKTEINDFLFGRPELLLDDADAYEEMNTYAYYMPYDKHQFEIDREQLEFDCKDILGTGAYGTVYKGTFQGNYGQAIPVAIKTVDPSSDKTYFAALLSEIKIMCYIGKHDNVVELVGACTKYLHNRQIFVATEYCLNGDLLSYIIKHRDEFIKNSRVENLKKLENQRKMAGNVGYCKLSLVNLILSPHLVLVWALQIAQGMAYLSSKKVIHGDLAARNVLLTEDLTPKIADFGLSNQLQKYANYVRKGDDLVPWRWLAVECLQFMKFSISSDVWAYGVLMFELFSLGQVPYANHTYSELFIVSLCQGERLQQPAYASNKLYNLMLECWKHSAEHRPSFLSIENELKIMRQESENKMLMSISSSGQLNVANPKMESTLFCGNDEAQQHAVVEERNLHKPPAPLRMENAVHIENKGYITDMASVVHQSQVPENNRAELNGALPASYVGWNAISV